MGIRPDPVIDAYMKASAAGKAKHSIVVRSRGNRLVAACRAFLQAAAAGTDAVTMHAALSFHMPAIQFGSLSTSAGRLHDQDSGVGHLCRHAHW